MIEESTWNDEDWKERIGDFEFCNFCTNSLKEKDGRLFCGEHWQDHKYMVPFQRARYLDPTLTPDAWGRKTP